MFVLQAMRTPLRDTTGVSLLFRYYNQLYFVERRFFPPDRSLGIYFEWFDSLTGKKLIFIELNVYEYCKLECSLY